MDTNKHVEEITQPELGYTFYQFSTAQAKGFFKISIRKDTASDSYVHSFVAQVAITGRKVQKLSYAQEYPNIAQATFLLDVQSYVAQKFDRTLSDTLSKACVAFLQSKNSHQVINGYARYTISGRGIASVQFDADIAFMAVLHSIIPSHIGIHETRESEDGLPYIGELNKVKQLQDLLTFGTQDHQVSTLPKTKVA